MKILNLSLDKKILDKNSAPAKRLVQYAQMVERYDVLVPFKNKEQVQITDNAVVYGSGGKNKISQFFHLYKKGKKLLKENDYSIITSQDQYYVGLIACLLANKYKKGLEIQWHGWEKCNGFRKIIAKHILLHTNAIRTVSNRSAKKLIKEFNIPKEKITVVPIFVPSIVRKDKAKQNKNGFVFLTVGRLTKVKNIAMQIKAVAKIIKNHQSIKLLIIGEGELKSDLQSLIKKYNLDESVKLLGWKEKIELDEHYSGSDCFLLTSYSEGWGMAVLEAGSFGLPIIMTDVGCAQEIIKDEVSGLIISTGDEDSLVNEMDRIIKDKELRIKLGNNAKQAVQNLPSLEEVLVDYKKSWQKALKSI